MAEAATEIGRTAHLPEQPRQALGPGRRLGRQESAERLGEMGEDRSRLEHAERLRPAAVDQRRNLRVRVRVDEPRPELVAVADLDQPGVVFGAGMAGGQQFLEQDSDLLAVGRAQGIELKRMLADRQCLVVRRAGDGPVDVGEAPAIGLVPDPDLRWRVVGNRAHDRIPLPEAGKLAVTMARSAALVQMRTTNGRPQRTRAAARKPTAKRSPDTTKPPGGGFAPTTVDPLRAALCQFRNDPGGGYCEGRRRCRDGGLHRITSFQN